jgi:hypothetical protein
MGLQLALAGRPTAVRPAGTCPPTKPPWLFRWRMPMVTRSAIVSRSHCAIAPSIAMKKRPIAELVSSFSLNRDEPRAPLLEQRQQVLEISPARVSRSSL